MARRHEKREGGQREELFGNAQSLKQSSLCCGTRLVDTAEEPELGCEVKTRPLSDTMSAYA